MKVVNRIKKNKDFAKTIRKGHTKGNKSFLIHFNQTTLSYIRVGISVSSKVGNAVVRNRIKRQVRAMCDLLFDYMNGSSDFVIIIRKEYLNNDFQTNKSLLSELIHAQIGKNE